MTHPSPCARPARPTTPTQSRPQKDAATERHLCASATDLPGGLDRDDVDGEGDDGCGGSYLGESACVGRREEVGVRAQDDVDDYGSEPIIRRETFERLD
jgi:hypothetical protein